MLPRTLLLLALLSTGALADSGRTVHISICRHPDDDGSPSGHAVRVCQVGPPVPGHSFNRYDAQKTITCDDCMLAHKGSPDSCQIVDITSPGVRIVEDSESDRRRRRRPRKASPKRPPAGSCRVS